MQLRPVRSLDTHGSAEKIHRILEAAIESADPVRAAARNLTLDRGQLAVEGTVLDLEKFNRIRLIGLGKASVGMAQGALKVLGSRIRDGYLISKHPQDEASGLPDGIQLVQGNHPVPGAGSLSAAQGLEAFLADTKPDDLVICLISGGGSSLALLPAAGVSLEQLQELTRLLLASGASINEINALRKHLDRIKGGGLARMAAPARLVTLILSDVIGSPLDVIASGPTAADESTYADALGVLEKYGLLQEAPEQIVDMIRKGAAGELPETVKAGDTCLADGVHVVVGSNQVSAEAAVSQAEKEGYNTVLLTTSLQDEASDAGRMIAGVLHEISRGGRPVPRPACVVAGGETTVTLQGNGVGGRNTELALGAVEALAGLPDVMLVTLATDGEDGTGDAAGAVVTGETLAAAQAAGLDPAAYLHNNDSFHFFQDLGDLLITGPTGTNVNDLVFLFAF